MRSSMNHGRSKSKLLKHNQSHQTNAADPELTASVFPCREHWAAVHCHARTRNNNRTRTIFAPSFLRGDARDKVVSCSNGAISAGGQTNLLQEALLEQVGLYRGFERRKHQTQSGPLNYHRTQDQSSLRLKRGQPKSFDMFVSERFCVDACKHADAAALRSAPLCPQQIRKQGTLSINSVLH
eukprot:1073737-Amphidinium_carterae.1